MNTEEKKTFVCLSDQTRRAFIACCSCMGLSATLLPGILWAEIQDKKAQKVSKEMLIDAEKLAGLEFTDEERDLMLEGINSNLESYEKLRTVHIDNAVSPALHFNPVLEGMAFETKQQPVRFGSEETIGYIDHFEELAFLPVTQLSQIIKDRRIKPSELTGMYLERLKKYNPYLECVITLTEELAMKQAEQADKEIKAGKYRGPLHGIPWGAKDLLAVKGYKTTWGAAPYKDQVIDVNATVVERLEQAGAILLAKLTLGALAWGDVWFGGKTKNPWNLQKGSSGSSAGPASATAGGLVGFAIGSETWGSIISPSTRCGVTGLRPTFGRVSKYGAMALSWSMDKLGPMCRNVEDCAMVFNAIYGSDGKDMSVQDHPFNYVPDIEPETVKVGYVQSAFEKEIKDKKLQKFNNKVLKDLKKLGFQLVPIELPELPIDPMAFILNAEAAAAFDKLTRSNRDDELKRQIKNAWPNVFRQSRLIPAVEYIQANRLRTMVMAQMQKIMSAVDVYVAPTFGNANLLLTNLTGHPAVVAPNSFYGKDSGSTITFTGRLFGEATLLAVAKKFQDQTTFHKMHPKMDYSPDDLNKQE